MAMTVRSTSLLLFAAVLLAVATKATVAESLTEALDQHFLQNKFSGAVIITKGGEILWSKAYGLANVEHGVKNTTKTKFRIGSVTKQFTAMAVLVLQEQKKLQVEDKVGKHLSDIPESWKHLTIHQLLTHTSGIMHSWALDDFVKTRMVPRTPDEVLALFHNEPLLFDPGQGYQYSGVGYFLLAKIVRTVSGMEYGAFLRREVFTPLGMSSTGVDTPNVILKHRAAGYVVNADGDPANAPLIHMPILTGGGNLYSTVEDLVRWGGALSERMLVSEASYQALYRVERNNYAYGWGVTKKLGQTVISHSGGVPGFAAQVVQLPEQDMFVAMLSNFNEAGSWRTMNAALQKILQESTEAGTHDERYFTASDGVKIHYLVAGKGETVILIHGVTGNLENWLHEENLLPQLIKHYRVVAIDLRGHGKSDKPHDPKRYGPQMGEDVVELMDVLGVERAHLHGFSMGCFIIKMVLSSHPDRVATVSLSGGTIARETDPKWIAQVPKEPEGEDPEQRRIREVSSTREWFDRKAIDALWNYPWESDNGASTRSRFDLTKIRTPILSIVGEYDAPNAKTHRLKRELPDFRSVVIPGKSHLTLHGLRVDNGDVVSGPLQKLYVNSLLHFLKEHPID